MREEIITPQVALVPAGFCSTGDVMTEQLHFKPAKFIRIQRVRVKYAPSTIRWPSDHRAAVTFPA